jgi:hypothetical protein
MAQPVTVHVPQAALDDLSQLVADPLGWHRPGGRLNRFSQFRAAVDGVGLRLSMCGQGPARLSLSWSRVRGASEGSPGT